MKPNNKPRTNRQKDHKATKKERALLEALLRGEIGEAAFNHAQGRPRRDNRYYADVKRIAVAMYQSGALILRSDSDPEANVLAW